MIDDRTPYLDLPLPHPDNLLSEDVLRLRQAVVSLDTGFQEQAALVAETLNSQAASMTTAMGWAWVAVLERFFPKILKNSALQMTAAMTLRQVAGFAQSGLTAESLAEIDAQLRALPSSEG